jgi:pectin methylesterase-like acyl-CoA thioesterase
VYGTGAAAFNKTENRSEKRKKEETGFIGYE